MSLIVSLPDATLRDAVGEVDGATLLLPGEPDADAPELLVAPYVTSPDALDGAAQMPHLRWVQLQSAGYDGFAERLPQGVGLANAAGVHNDATAELALGLVIASQRGIDLAVRAQSQGQWQQHEVMRASGGHSLADARVMVLGYGSIGHSIAVRLQASSAEVVAVASRARADDAGLVEQVYGVDELTALLPTCDVVISVLPDSEATRGLLNAEALALLPDGALVCNVGRGPVLDTDAALAEAGRLRFALDVTDPEPLPAGHPLWSAPGVLITPHVGGGTRAMLPRVAALVRAQVRRLVAGEPIANVVVDPR